MANEQFANALLVEVDGTPLPAEVAVLLTHAYVDDSRNLPDAFVLRFRDPARTVLARAGLRIGAGVRLSVQAGDASAPGLLMSGEVTAVEAEIDKLGSVTEVRGLDHAHRLFRGRRVAAYADMSVADVVRSVAERAGLRTGTIDAIDGVRLLRNGDSSNGQLTQDNVTDWEFLARLAEQTGAEVAVVDGVFEFRVPEQPGGAPAPGARASADPLVLEAHRNLFALRAGVTSAEQVAQVEVRGWDYLRKQEISATAPAKDPYAELTSGLTPDQVASAFGAATLLATDVPYRAHADASAAAGALATQVAGAFAEIEGIAKGNPMLRAGTPIALANVGEPFDGRYTLTSTRHLFSAEAGYTTAFAVTSRQERSLYGLANGGHGRGGRSSVGGLVPAVVSDVRDPQNLGRVKVTYPWLSGEYASGWARTVQAGAGAGLGAVVLPEVGAEVLVGFEQDDFDAPYVLGGLHNGEDALPDAPFDLVDANSGQVNGRYLVSRTGHRLEFAETSTGDDGVRLVTGDGKYLLHLDRKGTTVVVKSDGTVLIEGRKGITIDARTSSLELKGQTIAIKAVQQATLEGAQVKVSGSGQAELSSSGALTVRGSVVRLN